MRTKHVIHFLLFLLLFSSTVKSEDAFAPFRYFVGTWEGTTEGEPGKGTSIRKYEFMLGDKYLKITNTSTYSPQEKNPKGETHEDLGIVSFDKQRKTHILRQFHIEGFVNEYAVESISEDQKRIVFITESIENIPPGWKAREIYTIQDQNQFTEVFELAAPGAEFSRYSTAVYRRKE